MKIGIIGLGFVGGAVKAAHDLVGIETVDVDPHKGLPATIEDAKQCEAIYICVPSPIGADGACDTSILEDVVEQLSDYKGVIISKVTAPPSIYIKLQETHPNLVHAPEFLVAATANEDYINGTYAIIGGVEPYATVAEAVIVAAQRRVNKITKIGIGEAALTKYAINTFLSTKVIFMNELKSLAVVAGLDYDVVKETVQFDERQGNSHFDVPGPDGKYGFGGACFPKDTSALLKYAETLGVELTVLKSAVTKNNIIRNG
jgi:UDPglucose 6-dehydrogenase